MGLGPRLSWPAALLSCPSHTTSSGSQHFQDFGEYSSSPESPHPTQGFLIAHLAWHREHGHREKAGEAGLRVLCRLEGCGRWGKSALGRLCSVGVACMSSSCQSPHSPPSAPPLPLKQSASRNLSDSRPMVRQPQAGVLSLLAKWELLSTKWGIPVGTGPPVKTRASTYREGGREGGRWEPQRGVSGVMGLD